MNKAADIGLKRINERAAHTDDAIELLDSLPPLVSVNRYGTAREISLGHLAELINRLTIQAALALPYASRNLNDEEASHYCGGISKAHQSILLAELNDDVMGYWWQVLHSIVDHKLSSLQVAGLCARLLYLGKKIENETLQELLRKVLSPAVPAADAARFFEGFFAEVVQRLLYDSMLLETVENWLISMEDEAFVEFLPLFRRVFSSLDAMERKHLLDRVMGGRQSRTSRQLNPSVLPLWPQHIDRMNRLLQRDKQWHQ